MGRKIPAKHHHGVRDPIKQNRERFLKIRDKIDNPPENIKEQPVSRATAQFIKMKQQVKAGTFKRKLGVEDIPKPRKKKDKTEELPRPYKPTPDHKPLKGETARDFLRRVNRATTSSLKEAHYEAKYNVDIVRKGDGEVSVQNRAVDSKGAPKQSKTVQLNAKKKAKKEKKQAQKKEEEETESKAFRKDVFKFGEVCHRPPDLKTICRGKKDTESVFRPGKKNLLLHSLLNPEK
ncbi:hypothetical protein DMENIID0001_141420 [Sergentomyia squamirostris]